MIDYKNYFILKYWKKIKTFSDRAYPYFSMIGELNLLFRKNISCPKTINKILVYRHYHAKVVDGFIKMLPHQTWLSVWKAWPWNCMVFCNDDKLAFACYQQLISINNNKGTKNICREVNDFSQRDYADFNKTCVISYYNSDNNKPEFPE